MKETYTQRVKWKGQRTVGKGNEGMDRYNMIGLKKLKIENKEKKKKKASQNCKFQRRGRGL